MDPGEMMEKKGWMRIVQTGLAVPLEHLDAAGLSREEVARWLADRPDLAGPQGGDWRAAAAAASRFWLMGEALWRRLPPPPRRTAAERSAAAAIHERLRQVRREFLRRHGEAVYADLTDGYARFLRVDELAYRAAERHPGLTPNREAVAEDGRSPLAEKEGVERDQGLFLSQILALPRPGAHLVQAMLRPHPAAAERLAEFRRTGSIDLGKALVRREGNVGHLFLSNDRYLNAEDDSTLEPMEIGVDLILLDPQIEVGVLWGAPVSHPKYQGRRVFNSGINLTHIYHGKLSYLFYLIRDLGFVHKLYRGLSGDDVWPHEHESTLDKPWLAAVETFAIGGGCQLLLVVDHVLAEDGAYFNLPARKEGIIPGAANLRLPRFVADRLTRQAIFFDRQFPANSPEGRLICDTLVPAGQMDAAVRAAVKRLTESGLVSAASNRKALRVAQEPLPVFQAYMSVYAREQAECHFSPALVRNLEHYWNARERRL